MTRPRILRTRLLSFLIPTTFVTAALSASVNNVDEIHHQPPYLRHTIGNSNQRLMSDTDYHNNNNTFISRPRIINGRKVDHESERFPYFVSLRNVHDQHVCGGTLIASDIVLTAAHC